MKHQILTSNNVDRLNEYIADKLSDGWIIYGGFTHVRVSPTSTSGNFYQAVVKLDKKESVELILAANRLNRVE